MNAKLQELLPMIEDRLQKDDISEFKVGKTTNEVERFNDDEYGTYEYASIIACSDNPKLIAGAEADLIQHFQSHLVLKNKCKNMNKGSAGNPDATKLYIIAMGKNPRKGMEMLLDKFPLFKDLVICKLL